MLEITWSVQIFLYTGRSLSSKQIEGIFALSRCITAVGCVRKRCCILPTKFPDIKIVRRFDTHVETSYGGLQALENTPLAAVSAAVFNH